MKRFYKDAGVVKTDAGYGVVLDGKPLATPAKQPLVLPTEGLAKAIAAEWQGQTDIIVPTSMPLMQLAATVIDQLPGERAVLFPRLMAYVDNDLLCLREEAKNDLHALQDVEWQKPLHWLSEEHGIAMKVAYGLKPPHQPEFTHRAFKKHIEDFDDYSFVGLSEAASITGSLVLGLALHHAAYSSEQIFQWAELEALYQAKRWGHDDDAQKRHNAIKHDLECLATWFALTSQT
jgi:chaperone required for assembly of F1-ATPase